MLIRDISKTEKSKDKEIKRQRKIVKPDKLESFVLGERKRGVLGKEKLVNEIGTEGVEMAAVVVQSSIIGVSLLVYVVTKNLKLRNGGENKWKVQREKKD